MKTLPDNPNLAMFRGAVISLGNYVVDQVEAALGARDAEDQRYTARSVRHLLSSPPSRANLQRLLDVIQPSAAGIRDAAP